LKYIFFRQTRRIARLYSARVGPRRHSGVCRHAVQTLLHNLAGFEGQNLAPDDDDFIAVCGFLPLRGRLVLTTKLPKPDIFTFSPCSRLS
jgi:hypothetical protein